MSPGLARIIGTWNWHRRYADIIINYLRNIATNLITRRVARMVRGMHTALWACLPREAPKG